MKLKNKIPFFLILLMVFSFSLPAILFAQDDKPYIMMKRAPQRPGQKVSKERLALKYYQSQQYEKAAALYRQLYDENPKQYYYAYLLNCLVVMNEYKQAEKLVKKQKKVRPGDFRLNVDQAYLLKLEGNESKAQKIINEITENLPADKNRIIQIASALQSKGFYDQALKVYEKARNTPSLNYSYDLEMANAYQYTRDFDKMFDSYLNYLNHHPQDLQRIKNRFQMLLNNDVEENLSKILKSTLLQKAHSDPNNAVYADMLMWYAMQTKDFDLAFRQARAIDKRFKDQEGQMLEVADVALDNKQYELAAKAFAYLKDKKEKTPYYAEAYNGYFEALVKQAEANPETPVEKYEELYKTGEDALKELGLNSQSADIAANLAHILAFKLGRYDEALDLLNRAVNIPQNGKEKQSELKLMMADILLFKQKVWDATLLYSQVESDMKNEPIGHEAKFRNARLFYYIGEYRWAETKLDILKGATSKLIANDALELSLFIKDILEDDTTGATLRKFGQADLLLYRGKFDSAMMWLDSIAADPKGINTYQYYLYKKATALESEQKYAEADSMYNLLITQYPESIKTDNALFRRAEINRLYLNHKEKALKLYMKLMRDYPDSIYAGEARIIYREMKKGEEVKLIYSES
ncbi:MAG: tetratricopeptide repeat protein [Chlorobi bacterium]|nr:tetratricopeptide repeat protein [Chlorobiota bacterium]